MSSLLKGKTKQSRRNGGNGERQNLVAEWKEMELVCYLKELGLWDYVNKPIKCFFSLSYVQFRFFCEMLSCVSAKIRSCFLAKKKKRHG